MDLVRSAPSLPLWKCLGYFLLIAFGIEPLVRTQLCYNQASSLRHPTGKLDKYIDHFLFLFKRYGWDSLAY